MGWTSDERRFEVHATADYTLKAYQPQLLELREKYIFVFIVYLVPGWPFPRPILVVLVR